MRTILATALGLLVAAIGVTAPLRAAAEETPRFVVFEAFMRHG